MGVLEEATENAHKVYRIATERGPEVEAVAFRAALEVLCRSLVGGSPLAAAQLATAIARTATAIDPELVLAASEIAGLDPDRGIREVDRIAGGAALAWAAIVIALEELGKEGSLL